MTNIQNKSVTPDGSKPGLKWRTELLLLVGIFLTAFAVLVTVSAFTSSSVLEASEIAHARIIAHVLDDAAKQGALFWSDVVRDRVVSEVRGDSHPQSLASGWLLLVAAQRRAWLPALLAARFGHLLLASLCPAAVYLLARRQLGRCAALIAAALYLLVPRAIHLGAIASDETALSACWLAIALMYVRSLESDRWVWPIACGAVFGAALAISPTAWLAAVAVALHYAWYRRSLLRDSLRRGRLPAPVAVGWMCFVGPIVYAIFTPWLWADTANRAKALLLGSIAPSISPLPYGDALISAPPLPRAVAPLTWLLSLPLLTFIMVLIGAGTIIATALRSPRTRTGAAPSGALVSLCVVSMAAVLLWPCVAPTSLSVYPPRWMPALGFAAIFAAIGLDWCVHRIGERVAPRRRWMATALMALVFAVPAIDVVRAPTTLFAAYSALDLGRRIVSSRPLLAMDDGSIALRLASRIDGAAGPAAIYAPCIGAPLWDSSQKFGSNRANLHLSTDPREARWFLLAPGAQATALMSGSAGFPLVPVDIVRRDGRTIAMLLRR